MLASVIPHVSVVATFSRNILGVQKSGYVYFSQRHYPSIVAAANFYCSYNSNAFNCLDTRLLEPKASFLHNNFCAKYHILLKNVPSIKAEDNFRCSYNHSSNTNSALQSKYCFSTSNENNDIPPKKLTVVQRFKAMLKDYWHVLIPVHVITSIGWFGAFYYLATSGMDIPALMEELNFSETFVKPFRDSSMGYIAVAYGLYKIATPVRYTVTVGGTSIAINMLKKRGLVQPWPINFKWLQKKKK